MTDLHLDNILYLLHSCTHYYQSRGLPLAQEPRRYFYKTVRRARMLLNCTASFFTTRLYGDTRARYQTLRRLFYFRIRGLLHIFYYKTVRGHTTRLHGRRRLRILGASAHFLTTGCHGATTLMMEASFPVENRSFSIILYTYYTLEFTAI